MYRTTYVYIIILAIFFLLSCNRDEIVPTSENPPYFAQLASVNGQVIGQDNKPLLGVSVKLANKNTATDENGVFRFESVGVSFDGSVAKFQKSGYYDAFKFAFSETEENTYLQVKMIPKHIVGNVPGDKSSELVINGGAKIEFQENAFIQENGFTYQGVVSVSAHWYNPFSDEVALTLPGDLRGIDTEDNTVQLISYGMMAIELQGENGEEIELADGTAAKLSFPLPENNTAKDSIPMWSLNENTGIWIEEGLAIKEGDFMVAEVSHFSFWNCDDPFDLVNIKGRIVNTDGLPLSNYAVTIRSEEGNLSGYGVTNESGLFEGKVPSDVPLVMIINVCGTEQVFPLGILFEDQVFPDFVINDLNLIPMKLKLVDCRKSPISNGYVKLKDNSTLRFFIPNRLGIVETLISSCEISGYELVAFDFERSQQSQVINYVAPVILIEESELRICQDLTDEYFSYKTQTHKYSFNITFDEAEVIILDDKYIYIQAESKTSDAYIHLYYSMYPEQTPDFEADLFYKLPDENGILRTGIVSSNSPIFFEGNVVKNVGDVVIGSSPSFDFVFKVDNKMKSGSVKCQAWGDINKNGIQESNEPVPENLYAFIYNSSEYFSSISDENGVFNFDVLIPGVEYHISYPLEFGGAQPTPTITNAGQDNSLDSDFIKQNDQYYKTIFFTLEEGEVRTDLDLGILPH